MIKDSKFKCFGSSDLITIGIGQSNNSHKRTGVDSSSPQNSLQKLSMSPPKECNKLDSSIVSSDSPVDSWQPMEDGFKEIGRHYNSSLQIRGDS